MTRVLIVEDHRDIAEGIRDNLRHDRYEVRIETDGRGGLEAARRWAPDVIVLDLMLPGISGFELLRQLRAEGREVPVLILSARGDEMEKVRGFRIGADDYVTKPFGLLELMARIEALCRRAGAAGRVRELVTLRFGDLEVQPAARRVLRGGAELPLRPRELDLLLALLSRPQEAVSRQSLLETVWRYDPSVESRTVDWHVAELRRKIEADPTTPRHIVTVRKIGYRWDSTPAA